MATNEWLGRAKARAEEQTIEVSAYDAATTYTITVNGKSISTIAAGTADLTATALAAAWNAATEAEFAEVTASAATDTVTLTHDNAGVPFTVTTSESGGTGTIEDPVVATAATGPNHWDDINNWSLGAIPVDTNDVKITVPVGIYYGLGQSAVTLASLVISASFTESIGLPKTNAGGYTEYRKDYLEIGATAVRIGVGEGQGSGRIKINFGSVQTAVEARKSGSSLESGIPAILLKGTHASNALDAQGGVSVGVAYFPAEISTLTTLTTAAGALVICGEGVTLATFRGEGSVTLYATVTTATITAGGALTTLGSGTITTLTIKPGAACYYRSSGTVTTCVVDGLLDFSGDASARTFTTTTIGPGGRIVDPQQSVTFTNAVARSSLVREILAA